MTYMYVQVTFEISATEIKKKFVRINKGQVHKYLWSMQYTIFKHKTLCRWYYLNTYPSKISKIKKKTKQLYELWGKFFFKKSGH